MVPTADVGWKKVEVFDRRILIREPCMFGILMRKPLLTNVKKTDDLKSFLDGSVSSLAFVPCLTLRNLRAKIMGEKLQHNNRSRAGFFFLAIHQRSDVCADKNETPNLNKTDTGSKIDTAFFTVMHD